MAVEYSAVYEYIRTRLGDLDSTNYDYSSDMLDASITWVLLFEPVTGYAKVADSTTITPDITDDNDKTKELCLKACLVLLAPAETFSYRTAVLDVDRSGDTSKQDLIASIEEDLDTLLAGGNKPIKSDGSIDQYLTMGDRVEEIIDANIT